MTRYNNASIFRRLDLDDIDSIKRVMCALISALKSRSTSLKEEMPTDVNLSVLESAWVKQIFDAIVRNCDYTLLERLVVYFCASRLESPVNIKQTIKELENLAPEDVFMDPESHIEEYTEALKQFDSLPRTIDQVLMADAHVWYFGFSIWGIYSQFIVPRPRDSQGDSS